MKGDRRLIVRDTISKGLGVFTKAAFDVGDVVVCGMPVSISAIRTDHSFQVEFDKHVELDEPARLINHSCDPNLGVKNNKNGGYDFIAIKEIKVGDELTWDYCTTEYCSISIKGQCLCGSSICREKITGFVGLPKDLIKKYNGFVADYLKE